MSNYIRFVEKSEGISGYHALDTSNHSVTYDTLCNLRDEEKIPDGWFIYQHEGDDPDEATLWVIREGIVVRDELIVLVAVLRSKHKEAEDILRTHGFDPVVVR